MAVLQFKPRNRILDHEARVRKANTRLMRQELRTALERGVIITEKADRVLDADVICGCVDGLQVTRDEPEGEIEIDKLRYDPYISLDMWDDILRARRGNFQLRSKFKPLGSLGFACAVVLAQELGVRVLPKDTSLWPIAMTRTDCRHKDRNAWAFSPIRLKGALFTLNGEERWQLRMDESVWVGPTHEDQLYEYYFQFPLIHIDPSCQSKYPHMFHPDKQ